MDSATASLAALVVSTVGTVAIAWIGFRIKKLEHNTNSIKDALIASTAKASHAEGVIAGKAEATLIAPRPSQD